MIKFRQQDRGGGEAFLTRMLMPVLYRYSRNVCAENLSRKQQPFFNPLFAVGEITITERVVTADKGTANTASGYVIPGSLLKADLFGPCSRHGYSISAVRVTGETLTG